MQQPECTLVDVARFQSEGGYQLELVRRAVRANNIEDLHNYARAIKAMPLVAGFNLRPIGRAALVDAVELGNQAAVHALVTGFDLTAADVRSVKESINDPDLTDCLDCELMLLEEPMEDDNRWLGVVTIWLSLVLVLIAWIVCNAYMCLLHGLCLKL